MSAPAAPASEALRPRRRLFLKYVVVIVALVTTLLVASAGVELWFSYQESRDALVALQREKAAAAAGRIEAFVREIERQMGWTTLPLLAAGDAALEQRRIDFVRLQRQVPPITDLSYLDAEGKEQLRVSRLAMDVVGGGADFSADPRFTQAVARRVYHGPVYFRKESEPYMVVAMAQSGGGVTVAEVNLKFIWDVVTQIRIGKAGRAYVVDGAGTLIAHPDISLVLQKTSLSALPQVREALSGSAADPVTRDVQGRRVLTAHATIPGLGWTVFAEQPLEEALAPLQASLTRSLLLLAIGVSLAIGASLILARRMVRPIHALQVGAARIGGGELGHRLAIRTGDELETLAREFNRMTATLQESYATLEQRVDDRTRELTEALEQQTATSEILRAISRAQRDVQPVFDVIASSALNLCDAMTAAVFRRDATHVHLMALAEIEGVAAELSRQRFPMLVNDLRDTALGDALVEGRRGYAPDILTDPRAKFRDLARAVGYRAFMAVPMLREREPIGAIVVMHPSAGAFTDKQTALLETFADQAVIAIENVRLFTELQERTAQLQVASRHKDEFLANMSHELRTPLNAIIGFSEVMLERMFGEINDKQEEYLTDILTSGRHLLSLINDILDLSKIEAGRMDLDLGEFNLAATIDNAVTLVHERAARRGVTLAQDVDGTIADFRGDERKIKQVLLNLLSNAIKFTPEGGRVEVRAALKGDVMEVAVHDTGVGIAPEDQETVFEEFRQVGTDRAKKHEGTGLGLALARRFVELHGGNLWVESEVGAGSTFTFALPVRRSR